MKAVTSFRPPSHLIVKNDTQLGQKHLAFSLYLFVRGFVLLLVDGVGCAFRVMMRVALGALVLVLRRVATDLFASSR